MIFILMGVSGAGKTTLGRKLSEEMGFEYHDADDYHPQSNIDKMTQSIPLSDEDRMPWLHNMHAMLETKQSGAIPVLLACSALKSKYRSILRENIKDLQFIYLKASKETIIERFKIRQNHFMPATIIDSQFAVLEEPTEEEAHHLDINGLDDRKCLAELKLYTASVCAEK